MTSSDTVPGQLGRTRNPLRIFLRRIAIVWAFAKITLKALGRSRSAPFATKWGTTPYPVTRTPRTCCATSVTDPDTLLRSVFPKVGARAQFAHLRTSSSNISSSNKDGRATKVAKAAKVAKAEKVAKAARASPSANEGERAPAQTGLIVQS